MSANTDYYWKRIQDTEANPVAAYTSKYQAQLDNALNAITNRKAFSYDFNADPMYQMYKDQYTKLGNEAAQNAAASVSALTGGFGNSYATTAASQANQQYLTKLNEVIPELYNLAMNRYRMEGDELNNRFNVLGQAEDRDYGRYRDQVADYNDLLAYLQGAYGTQLSNDQWRAELDEKIREFDLEYALKNRPLGGGGGGTVYLTSSNDKQDTKNSTKGLNVDLLKNALKDEVYYQVSSGDDKLYKTPSERLENTILANKIYQATADAVNNGIIPNTKKAQTEYIEDLTKGARTVKGW